MTTLALIEVVSEIRIILNIARDINGCLIKYISAQIQRL